MPADRDRDVAAFDRRADGYERGRLARWHAEVVGNAVELALAVAPRARRVLDVGAGTGALLRSLAQRLPDARELVGIDPAPAMIAAARAAPGLDPRIGFRLAGAEAMPLPSSSFDLVLSTTSFAHWADQRAGLAECRRVLDAGGRLVLVDLFAVGLARLGATLGRRRDRIHTPPEVEALLAGAGLVTPRWDPIYRLGPLTLVHAVTAGLE